MFISVSNLCIFVKMYCYIVFTDNNTSGNAGGLDGAAVSAHLLQDSGTGQNSRNLGKTN